MTVFDKPESILSKRREEENPADREITAATSAESHSPNLEHEETQKLMKAHSFRSLVYFLYTKLCCMYLKKKKKTGSLVGKQIIAAGQ